jgi:hypothetical protein
MDSRVCLIDAGLLSRGGIEVLNIIKKQAFFSDSAGTFHT